MEYRIECAPSFSVLEATLEENEKLVTEAGAMCWMSPNLEVKTASRGGIGGGLKRAMLTGESFFQNTYWPRAGSGTLGVAPGSPGDIIPYELQGGSLVLEKGAYLASTEGVETDSKFDGFKGLFNEGMFVLRVSGTGILFFNGYGDINEVEVDGEYVVDNGFAVAWEPSLSYTVTRARQIRSFLFADQILLNFSGKGRLWIQSRSPRALASFFYPFRPTSSS